jgi:hypothetical protein
MSDDLGHLIRAIHQQKRVYTFTKVMTTHLIYAGRRDPTIKVKVYSKPTKLPHIVTPVWAEASVDE